MDRKQVEHPAAPLRNPLMALANVIDHLGSTETDPSFQVQRSLEAADLRALAAGQPRRPAPKPD